MTTRKTRTLIGAAALALGLTLSACGSDDEGSSGNGEDAASSDLELINSGTLTVCSEIPYRPFEFEEDGEYTGFDIDLMRAMAEGAGLELEVAPSSFDALASGLALNSGQCDVVASAMTITEEREQNVTFLEPYYDSKQSLLVPTGSDIESIDDLGGKKVAVQSTTTGEMYAQENAPEDARLVGFPGDQDMFSALRGGQVDAILQDLPVNLGHTEDGRFEIVEEYDTEEQYGFAVKKEGAEKLADALNAELAELRENGDYQELYDKYFSVE